MHKQTSNLALGGVLAALAVVILLLGGVLQIATYLAPMLASALLAVLLGRLPRSLCLGWWAAVSLLALLLCPDKELAFVFLFLGWYPMAKPALDRLPKLPRLLTKLLIFNAATAALYGFLILVLRLEALVQEARETGAGLLILLLVLGNLTFLLFDLVLSRLPTLLQHALHKK